jgi:hypothetical protein
MTGRFNLPDTRALVRPDSGPWFHRLREKRWCFVGIVHPDLFFGAAVIHLGYLTSGFGFGVVRKTGRLIEQNRVCPPLGQVRFDLHPEKGVCCFKTGSSQIRMSARGDTRTLTVDLACGLQAQLILGKGADPVHFPMPMAGGARAFTTKVAGLTVQGTVQVQDRTFHLTPGTGFALLDWTHGVFPYHTFWNWACGAGYARDTTRVGINFSTGVYEAGQTENQIWVNGCPRAVGPVRFDYDPDRPERAWQIHSADGQVDLTFTPEVCRWEQTDFNLIQSRFLQPWGTFKGHLGPNLILDRVHGVVEEHFATW